MTTKTKKMGSDTVNAREFLESLDGPLTIGSYLESIRLGEELSLAAFAKKLGISASHLCDIEKGRKAVSISRANEFAKKLGKSTELFIQLAIEDEIHRSEMKEKIEIRVKIVA